MNTYFGGSEKPLRILNKGFIEKQNLSEKDKEKLSELYQKKKAVYELMENESLPELLRSYNRSVEIINFEIQKTLHITLNKDFHDWYLVPHCQCPKKENERNTGKPERIYVSYCPIHG